MTPVSLTQQPAHYSATLTIDLHAMPQVTQPVTQPTPPVMPPAPPVPDQPAPPTDPLPNAIRQEEDEWVLTFNGRTFRFPNPRQKGFRYIAILLERPHQTVAARDLKAVIDGTDPRLLSTATMEVADSQAIADATARLIEITEELDEAADRSDWRSQERLEEEKDQLVVYLAAAKGLHDKPRQTGEAENIRLAVRNCIARTLDTISKKAPDLAAYLTATIRLGHSLAYEPFDDDTWVVDRA